MDQLLLYPSTDSEMLISSRGDCLLISVQLDMYHFMLLENRWENIVRP